MREQSTDRSERGRRTPALPCLRPLARAILAGLIGLGLSATAMGQAGPPQRYVEGVVLVGYRAGTPAAARTSVHSAARALRASPLSRLEADAEKLQLAPGASVSQAIKALLRNPNVRYAEPDYILTKAATSNDPYYTGGNLWGMYGDTTLPANVYGSQAGEAWAAGYIGSSQVYVGVIDEGIQYSHPDLAANVWTNPGEIAGNGIDDDGNGRVDDVRGWDFWHGDASVFDAGEDDHGTHVAGTIGGAGGNGTGVVGVNWHVKLIPAKFIGPSNGNTSGAIAAIDYITDLKTRHNLNIVATSNSWGGSSFSQALLDAINRGGDRGILFVTAAGNDGTNIDATPDYPSSFQCTTPTRLADCLISVAAINSTGARSSFSNYGATAVDLGAPGSGIFSTLPMDTYGSYNGTSMATPHVAGAAALCASIDATQTARDLRFALLGSTAPTASLAGATVTGGRLDIGAMLAACLPPSAPVTGGPASLSATDTGTTSIRLTWTDGATGEGYFEVERSPAGCASFAPVTSVIAGTTTYDVTGLTPGTTYCFRVRAGNRLPSVSTWSGNASATTRSVPVAFQCNATAFQWEDISAAPMLSLWDDSSTPVFPPFAWSFYGTAATQMIISSNGFVRLDGGAATQHANVSIPNAADPNAYVAPLWDDLDPGAGGAVRTATLGTAPSRRFVVSWDNVPRYNVLGSTLSFQAVFEETTGDLVFNYLDVVAGNAAYDRGASATAGIESPAGDGGILLSYNSPSLNDATAYRCTPPPSQVTAVTMTPTRPSPLTVGGTVTFGAVATGGNGIYEYMFLLRPPGGTLNIVRDYSATPTWSWWTYGFAAGTYQVVVRARNVGSTRSYEAYQSISYGLAAAPYSVILSWGSVNPATIGTAVTFSAFMSGTSGQYEYMYLLRLPGGALNTVRPYSTTNYWNWDTQGLPAGTYQVVVRARAVGSSKSYDVYRSINFGLVPGPAQTVALVPVTPSPATTGTLVEFGAEASGGSGSYQYTFLLRPPGGTLNVVRDYSTSPSWQWITTGMQPGTYQVVVRARNAGSTKLYEAYRSTSYVLTAP